MGDRELLAEGFEVHRAGAPAGGGVQDAWLLQRCRPDGKPRVVFGFSVLGGRVIRIDLLADPAVLAGLRIDYPDA